MKIYFLLNLQSAEKKLSSFATFSSGVGSGRPPQVMFFLFDLEPADGLAPDLAATGLLEGADLLPASPPKSDSRLEGGIFDPGQLNDGMALIALCRCKNFAIMRS